MKIYIFFGITNVSWLHQTLQFIIILSKHIKQSLCIVYDGVSCLFIVWIFMYCTCVTNTLWRKMTFRLMILSEERLEISVNKLKVRQKELVETLTQYYLDHLNIKQKLRWLWVTVIIHTIPQTIQTEIIIEHYIYIYFFYYNKLNPKPTITFVTWNKINSEIKNKKCINYLLINKIFILILIKNNVKFIH